VSAPPVVAPWSTDPALLAAVEQLRRAGRRVMHRLPGAGGDLPQGAEVLVQEGEGWSLRRADEV
jgi:ATP phosphoribosyltransferase regulatory subunit